MMQFPTCDPAVVEAQERAREAQEVAQAEENAEPTAENAEAAEAANKQREEAVTKLKQILDEGDLLVTLLDELPDDEAGDDGMEEEEDSPKKRLSTAFIPPPGSPLHAYLLGLKNQIVYGTTDLWDGVLAGRHLLPPTVDPVASCRPTNPCDGD
jgi:hypothetical protein